MADERDPSVAQRYRELGGEQPPPAVDQAILGAARRAVASRRRWYLPLAAAAILVLAVGVALQVQREQPEPQPSAVEQEKARVPSPELRRERKRTEENAARDSARSAGAQSKEERAPAPAAAPPVPQTAPLRAMKPAESFESPEQWLERIAQLRGQGRDEAAEKALAEFRRTYPDYVIPPAMLERVETK